MPYRASASALRVTCTSAIPETCSTFTSLAPFTVPRSAAALSANVLEHFEVWPEHLDGEVAFHAGDQFVDPEGDGLGEGHPDARHLREVLAERLDELRLVASRLPLLPGLEHDEDIRLLGPHGVLGDFSAPRFADHRGHFGEFQKPLFQHGSDRDGPIQGGVGQAHHVDGDGTLVQRGHELRAHEGNQ